MKFQLERILLFSDAVFAIAITLMIIEIKPPHIAHGASFAESFRAFLNVIPQIFGTVLSFCMIGLYWFRHHDLMQHLVAYNVTFIQLNFVLLLAVAFIPFSTAFTIENSTTSFTLLVYNLNYIVVNVLNFIIYKYALNPKNNLCVATVSDEISVLKKDTLFSISVFTIVIILGFFNCNLAVFGYALFGFYGVFVKDKPAEIK
ncbi:TMEM175 family protein [Flavobacterium sp.]|uniref:TMEM175 family protein n=1 Tax=Flavobacterium sp. TaxID=239 RepID=UPI00260D36F2|nr:TMEM175 family protein [Flavobacterium sp.]